MHTKINIRPRKVFGLISIILLFSTHILLPLEFGFPALKISGLTVNYSIIFDLIVFLITWLTIKKNVPFIIIDKYIIFQFLFVFVLLFGSLMSESPLTSLRFTVTYFFAWVINYIVLKKYIDKGYDKYVILIICGVAYLSAVEAIFEALGYVPPLYIDWRLNYCNQYAQDIDIDNVGRVLGTVGNPLVLGATFVMMLPFVFSLKNVYLKIVLVLLIVTGAFLTVSKTIIFMAIIFFGGYFAFMGKKHVIILTIVAVLFLTLFFSTSYFDKFQQNLYYQLWFTRLTMETDRGDTGISNRKEVARALFNKMGKSDILEILSGHGNLSEVSLGEGVSANYRTVDNMYLTVLYNNGLFGLIIFLVAFLYPAMNKNSLGHKSLYWYNCICFMLAGLSFVCYPYSGLNVLMVTSYILMNKKRGLSVSLHGGEKHYRPMCQ